MSDWENDCLRWRGVLLTGKFAHWCLDWDFLPVDETTPEFECCTCDVVDKEGKSIPRPPSNYTSETNPQSESTP